MQIEAVSGSEQCRLAACGDATRNQRWTAYALAVLAAALTVAGMVAVATSTTRPNDADADDSDAPPETVAPSSSRVP